MRTSPARMTYRPAIALLAPALLALGACSGNDGDDRALDELDAELTQDGDPAVEGDLEEEILIDPELAGSAMSGKSLMSAGEPRTVTDKDLCETCGDAAAAPPEGTVGACRDRLDYGPSWADRLPAAFPLFPNAILEEAAGVDEGPCDLRVATFATSNALRQVVDYYYTRAKRAGFTAEYVLREGTHALGGVRQSDDSAYYITFEPREGGGTTVAIIANNGR